MSCGLLGLFPLTFAACPASVTFRTCRSLRGNGEGRGGEGKKIMLREKVFWLDSKMGDTSRSSSSPCVCVLVGTRLVCWPCLRVLGAHLIRRSCLGVVPAFVQLSKSPAPRVTSLLATIWPPRKPFSGLTT